MGGHMGVEQNTSKNLEVVVADPERNLIMVKGAVPGGENGIVMIKLAKKSVKGK
jgi:large subunit ribosomal protein L3